MSTTGYLGDRHPGQWMPFWQQACTANARGACENLMFLQEGFCEDGSGWACNEYGVALADDPSTRGRAGASFERACGLQFAVGCDNARTVSTGGTLRHAPPTVADYQFVLRGSKGPVPDREPAALTARACDQGWPGACAQQRSSLR